jgi:primosomal protein N''
MRLSGLGSSHAANLAPKMGWLAESLHAQLVQIKRAQVAAA